MFITDFNEDLRIKRVDFIVEDKCASIVISAENADKSNEEYARLKFDFESNEVIQSGVIYHTGLKRIFEYWDFSELMMHKRTNSYKSKEDMEAIIQSAMDTNPYFKKIAEDTKLISVCKYGMEFVIMWLFEYIHFKSFKVLISTQLGQEILEKFNNEFHCRLVKIDERFKDFFKEGNTIYEILGIKEQDNAWFDRYLNNPDRFYEEWYIYTIRNNNHQTYFY